MICFLKGREITHWQMLSHSTSILLIYKNIGDTKLKPSIVYLYFIGICVHGSQKIPTQIIKFLKRQNIIVRHVL